ncbi:MAG: hypothetical protein QNJ67_12810 [Kiloniellales bacterium]|nr:hypothetical protein [Kiloniellales bacterium]
MDGNDSGAATSGKDCKLIICILPDDGTHRTLLKDLRANRKAVRVSSQSCLGIDAFADAKAKPGTLPDAYLIRYVQIVVNADEADVLFEYVLGVAQINRPGGGMVVQAPLLAASHYALPEGIPDE